MDEDRTETSDEWLRRFQAGDESALGGLWAEHLPRLHRWARSRFSSSLRDGTTAEDLVQEAFVRSLSGLRTFQPRGAGAVFGYLRTIVLNQIRDHARVLARRPRGEMRELAAQPHPGPSPFEQVLGREVEDRYARSLATLSASDRQLLEVVVDQPCSDRELAVRLAKPSRDAARVARHRAVARLAEAMALRQGFRA